MRLLACLLAAVLAHGTPATAPQAPIPTHDPDRVAGWYSASGTTFLVTWGPTGGYRLLDFAGARFHALRREADDLFTVRGDGAWKDAGIRVTRRDTGARPTLQIASPGGTTIVAAPALEYPFDVEEVRVASGGATLGGVLLLPRVRKLVGTTGQRLSEVAMRLPAVTVLHGSGDSDRDNVWAYTFAWAMARTGFVTLFLDKRGSGASGGDWRTTGLDGLADDAVAGIDRLRAHPRVDAARVGVVGLSQGGLVAALATRARADLAFAVSISSAPMPLFVQMRHERTQDLRRASVPEDGIAAILAVAGLSAAYSRSQSDADWATFASALDGLRAGPWARGAAMFPTSRTDWHWRWWNQVGDVDPLPAWRDFTGAALAVFGADDETDNVPVKRSVALLAGAWQPERATGKVIRVFPDRGHTLVDPARRWIDDEILTLVTDWALRVVGGLDSGK